MATLKLISMRLKSVKSIQKITKSMKMVAAAKYNRAERELRETRNLGEGTQIFFDKTNIAASTIEDSAKDQKLVIAVTSDRGLCGAVHTQIFKAIKAELQNKPGDTKIVCIGDKAKLLLQGNYRNNIVLVVNEIGKRPPSFLDASKIALLISGKHNYTLGKIYYNKFNSVVSYNVSHIPLFSEYTVLNAPKTVVYDDLDSEILDSYLEFSLASMIFYTMKENACSELASRMTAMDNASKNAGEMIDMLTLQFNRTRQGVITRELIEIISGAAALK